MIGAVARPTLKPQLGPGDVWVTNPHWPSGQDVDGLVGLRGGEQPLSFDIERHVIGVRTGRNFRHLDGLREYERLLGQRGGMCRAHRAPAGRGEYSFECPNQACRTFNQKINGRKSDATD